LDTLEHPGVFRLHETAIVPAKGAIVGANRGNVPGFGVAGARFAAALFEFVLVLVKRTWFTKFAGNGGTGISWNTFVPEICFVPLLVHQGTIRGFT